MYNYIRLDENKEGQINNYVVKVFIITSRLDGQTSICDLFKGLWQEDENSF